MSDYNPNNSYNYNYTKEEFDLGTDNLNNGGYDYQYASSMPEQTGFARFGAIEFNRVMTKSFVFMFFALLITAFSSMLTSPQMAFEILTGGSYIVFFIVEIAIVLAGNYAVSKNNAVLAGILYTVYSFMTGIILSIIYVAYTKESITNVFFITAGMFVVMAIIGLVSKKNLSAMGSFLMMGLIGIIIAGAVNMFLRSAAVDFLTSVIAVVIFAGLTAYDTQKMKRLTANATTESENSIALLCAFELYLDFVNLFLRLLRLMGKRK